MQLHGHFSNCIMKVLQCFCSLGLCILQLRVVGGPPSCKPHSQTLMGSEEKCWWQIWPAAPFYGAGESIKFYVQHKLCLSQYNSTEWIPMLSRRENCKHNCADGDGTVLMSYFFVFSRLQFGNKVKNLRHIEIINLTTIKILKLMSMWSKSKSWE